jgi:hypothetical protein
VKNGLDTNLPCGASAACLNSHAIDFVLRYYCADNTNPKCLTQAEAAALTAANIEIGTIFEDGPANPQPSDYTHDQGNADGASAWAIAQALGQPTVSCIYFAIDCDVPPGDAMNGIIDYFRGIQEGMQGAAGTASLYKIGVYGAGAVCQAIKQDTGLAAYSMKSLSPGWGGFATYGGWDIQQAAAIVPLCSFAVANWDEDQALDDFGGFFYQSGSATGENGTTHSDLDRISDVALAVRALFDAVIGSLAARSNEIAENRFFFPKGVESIELEVKAGPVEVALKITGSKAGADK